MNRGYKSILICLLLIALISAFSGCSRGLSDEQVANRSVGLITQILNKKKNCDIAKEYGNKCIEVKFHQFISPGGLLVEPGTEQIYIGDAILNTGKILPVKVIYYMRHDVIYAGFTPQIQLLIALNRDFVKRGLKYRCKKVETLEEKNDNENIVEAVFSDGSSALYYVQSSPDKKIKVRKISK